MEEDSKPCVRKLIYPARIANKGNVTAVVVPVLIINEMGLNVGDLVQVTLEKL